MYTYDDDDYVFEGDLISKTGEEGNVLHLQAAMNTSVSDVTKAAREYMLNNRNANNEPFMYAVVELVFSSIEVINPSYKEMLMQSAGKPAQKSSEDGRGGK